MNKLIVSFALMFFFGSLLTSIVTGDSDILVTRVASGVTESATTIEADDTNDWPKTGAVTIGAEVIYYRDIDGVSFVSCERGQEGTQATSHAIRSKIYGYNSRALNEAEGYNVTEVSSDGGAFALPTMVWGFVWHGAAKLMMWDYPFLKVGYMVYLRSVLQCFTIGFAIMFFLNVFMALWRWRT